MERDASNSNSACKGEIKTKSFLEIWFTFRDPSVLTSKENKMNGESWPPFSLHH
jgi:hypothetical protein